jgi:hypothetical protein
MAAVDSNGDVGSGSFSRTQTCSASTDVGVKGILLINEGGVSASANTATAVAAAALQPTILIQTVQSASSSADAQDASAGISANAGAADAVGVVSYQASRPMLPPAANAVASSGYNASTHLDVNAHDATVNIVAGDGSAYYGAAVVRVYVIPSENRTYKVQR